MMSVRAILSCVAVAWTLVYGGLKLSGSDDPSAARHLRSLAGADSVVLPRQGKSQRRGWLGSTLAGLGSRLGFRESVSPEEASSTWPSDVAARALGPAATSPAALFVGDGDQCSTCGRMVAVKFKCISDRVNGTAVYDCECSSQVQGYINYIMFHECTMQGTQWLSFVALISWLVFLLYMLGDTADVYFCPTLDVIVLVLNMSPNIAGVTFLSFGNGAPDVFASLAATLGGNPDVGVSAILGAGVFVTTVVVGAVAFSSEVQLDRRPFLRDVGFYVGATAYLLFCFADRKVTLGEAIGFLVIYVVFAVVVVAGRSIYQRWKKRGAEPAPGDVTIQAGAGSAGEALLGDAEGVEASSAPKAVARALDSDDRRGSGISMQKVGGAAGGRGARGGRLGGAATAEDVMAGSGRAAAGERSLSIDWFFAESQKVQLTSIAEVGADGDDGADGEGGAEGSAAPSPAAAAASPAGPAASPALKTVASFASSSGGIGGRRSSRRDLAVAHAKAHTERKVRRSLAPDAAAGVIAAGRASRRLSDGDVRHRIAADAGDTGFSWLEPVHVPRGMFSAHERRTRQFLRAVGYGEEAPDKVARRGAEEGGEGGSDGDEEAEEEAGMCDAYCGDHTTMGVVLYWLLLPSSLVRQASTPLVGEDEYRRAWAVVTPLFGVPLVFLTAFASIGDASGALDAVGGGGPGGFSYVVLAFVLGAAGSVASYFLLPAEGPPRGVLLTVFVLFGFLTSVSWIISIANEIVTLLVALGFALQVSAEILGLTVLAWGNSLGDLVADVSVAKAGKPKMALAACFAGPLFNLLMGLGLSLTVQTLRSPTGVVDLTNPSGNSPLDCHQVNIVWACFGFLLASLVLSMVVVPLDGFRVRKYWGLALMVLYALFLGTSFMLQFTDIGCAAASD